VDKKKPHLKTKGSRGKKKSKLGWETWGGVGGGGGWGGETGGGGGLGRGGGGGGGVSLWCHCADVGGRGCARGRRFHGYGGALEVKKSGDLRPTIRMCTGRKARGF